MLRLVDNLSSLILMLLECETTHFISPLIKKKKKDISVSFIVLINVLSVKSGRFIVTELLCYMFYREQIKNYLALLCLSLLLRLEVKWMEVTMNSETHTVLRNVSRSLYI